MYLGDHNQGSVFGYEQCIGRKRKHAAGKINFGGMDLRDMQIDG